MQLVFLNNTQSVSHGTDGSHDQYVVKANRCYVEVGLVDQDGNRIDSVQQQIQFRCSVFDTRDPKTRLDVIDGNDTCVTHSGSASFQFRLKILSGKTRRAFFIRMNVTNCESGEELTDGINTDSFIIYSKKPKHSIEHEINNPHPVGQHHSSHNTHNIHNIHNSSSSKGAIQLGAMDGLAPSKKRYIKTEGPTFANDHRETKQAKTETHTDTSGSTSTVDQFDDSVEALEIEDMITQSMGRMTFEATSSSSPRTARFAGKGPDRTGTSFQSFPFHLKNEERYPSSYSVYAGKTTETTTTTASSSSSSMEQERTRYGFKMVGGKSNKTTTAGKTTAQYGAYRDSTGFDDNDDDEDHLMIDQHFHEETMMGMPMSPGAPTKEDLDLLHALESTQLFAEAKTTSSVQPETVESVEIQKQNTQTLDDSDHEGMSIEEQLRQQVFELQRQLSMETESRSHLLQQFKEERKRRKQLEKALEQQRSPM